MGHYAGEIDPDNDRGRWAIQRAAQPSAAPEPPSETRYTLITVTNAGEVSHSRGYETLRMCEQAKSIALTGMTIEENEAADAAYKAAKDEEARRWREKHPPRVPTTDEREKLTRCITIGGSSPYSTLGADGLVYDWPAGGLSMGQCYYPNEGESVEWVRGQSILKRKHDIKYAKCVIETDQGDAGKEPQTPSRVPTSTRKP